MNNIDHGTSYESGRAGAARSDCAYGFDEPGVAGYVPNLPSECRRCRDARRAGKA